MWPVQLFESSGDDDVGSPDEFCGAVVHLDVTVEVGTIGEDLRDDRQTMLDGATVQR